AVPVWQGATWSGAATRLTSGCAVLAGLVGEVLGRGVRVPGRGAGPTVEDIPCDPAATPTVRGVANRAALVANRRPQLDALENPEGPVLTVGASCAADLVPAGVARYRYGERLGLLWLDTHPDCNTADSSPSGAFNGMVLRALLGEGDPDFAAAPPVAPGRAVLAGAAVFDEEERRVADRGLVRAVPARPDDVVGALTDAGVHRVYVHLDLDLLDRDAFGATVGQGAPGTGVSVAGLVAVLDALADLEVVGAAITECTAADRAEVLPLVPVVEALGRRLGG
ncbi:arginase family protein, partial [Saccharomonospora iraqiensis]|uniref:arginase family protein n=1 Tax=Saccharomonospora iraqiensis TaxID=52698 RepID=UPI001F27DD01